MAAFWGNVGLSSLPLYWDELFLLLLLALESSSLIGGGNGLPIELGLLGLFPMPFVNKIVGFAFLTFFGDTSNAYLALMGAMGPENTLPFCSFDVFRNL